MRGSVMKRCSDNRRQWPRCPHAWTIVVSVGSDDQGRKRQIWRTVKGSREDAQRELTRLLHEHDSGAVLAPTKMKLSEYLEGRWLPHMRTRIRASTFDRYETLLRLHVIPQIGGVELSRLRPVHIQQAVDVMVGEGAAARSTVQAYRVLSGALRQAVRWQLIALNPATAVQPPRISRAELTVPDPETITGMLAVAKGTPAYLPLLLAASTGLRRGEVAGVHWKDVDLTRARIHVTATLQRVDSELRSLEPKTPAARRSVSLPPAVVDVLRDHRREQAARRLALGPAWHDLDLVVERGDGLPHDPDTLSHWATDAAEKVGAPGVRFHDLRHGFATALLREGVNPKVVSEALGHTNVGFTLSVYSHVLPGMGDRAAEAIGKALNL